MPASQEARKANQSLLAPVRAQCFTPGMTTPAPYHSDEPHRGGLANRLNWLRAGVLGANDGIVSVAALAVGVASATPGLAPVLTAVLAGLVGGAISMAAGEYVSVSSQSDSERALIAKERRELTEMPQEELAELVSLYERKGLSANTARQVAHELTERDALAAHLDAELNLDPTDIVSPWRAALASAVAFTIGGVLPLLAVLIFPEAVADSGDHDRGAGGPRDHRCDRRPLGLQPDLAPDHPRCARRGHRPGGHIPARSTRGHDGPRLAPGEAGSSLTLVPPATDERHEHVPRAFAAVGRRGEYPAR